MKDLLGEQLPDAPPMTAPLPWRVFMIDSCDWWVARSLDEAIAGFREQTGLHDADLLEARELTDAELDRLVFVDLADDPEHGRDPEISGTIRRSFRQELARRVAAGLSRPEIFASTEY